MYILGLHTSHDTSACLLKDGKIVVAIEKERLSRCKHHRTYHNMQDIVNYCLEYEKISLADIEYIVVNSNNNIFKKIIFSNCEHAISHHLAHAWSAVGLSPYEECAILILDGEGSKVIELSNEEREVCNHNIEYFSEKESCYLFKNNTLHPLKKWTSRRGDGSNFSGTETIGAPYWMLSHHFFHQEHQEAKIMGLASYGNKDRDYCEMFDFKDGGNVEIDKKWIFRLKEIPGNNLSNNIQKYADIANAIQCGTEDAILHKAKWIKETYDIDNLCFSGGVALNCVANSKLTQSNIFKNVFIPFGAGDSSIAIGCAFYGWYVLAKRGKVKNRNIVSPYLGKIYSPNEIKGAINRYCSKQLITFEKQDNYIKSAAQQLSDGDVIAWFQGRSEFGPRALGNRSILANPGIKGIRDDINKKVKFRESFRPFAPAIIENHTGNWFENFSNDTYYMQSIADVKKDKRAIIPEVTHIDNTARIQIVSKEINPVFYDLISQFSKLSNIPILLNTSFNIQEPIVESPNDAILTFITSNIDSLYISDYHIKSLVEVVKDPKSINDEHCFIVGHKNIQLQCNLPDKYFIQILDGLNCNFKFGKYTQVSGFKSVPISKSLYSFIMEKGIERGAILDLSKLEILSIKKNSDEFKTVILNSRIATIVKKKM